MPSLRRCTGWAGWKVASSPTFSRDASAGDTDATSARSAPESESNVPDADEPRTAVTESIRRGSCDLVINTPFGQHARSDGYLIREAALVRRVPSITTLSGAAAAVHAIANARAERAVSLQERIDAETRTA